VKEISVFDVAAADTFCTIMSILISASASARKMAAASPGRSGTPTTVIFDSLRSCATPEMIACSTERSSIEPVTRVPGSCEYDERTCTFTPYRRPYSTHLRCNTLVPQAAISSISSYVTVSSRRAVGTMRGSAVKTPSTSV
jgi:hypothetical protein